MMIHLNEAKQDLNDAMIHKSPEANSLSATIVPLKI